MSGIPHIRTQRLVLRPYTEADAPDVQRLAGDARVADTTLTVPHPYPDGIAEAWIATHEAGWHLGRSAVFAIATIKDDARLVGTIGLTIKPEEKSAELGYWIGVPFWGHGYCTEAARAVIDFAFVTLELDRVHAHYFARNQASGRVMQKSGMIEEYHRPRAIAKHGVLEDICGFAITRSQWRAAHVRA